MDITARELNRSTLARRLLLGREPLGVPDAVRRLVALQARHAASPYVALWNRLADFDLAEFDEACARYTVVKATLLQMTPHSVHASESHGAQDPMLTDRSRLKTVWCPETMRPNSGRLG